MSARLAPEMALVAVPSRCPAVLRRRTLDDEGSETAEIVLVMPVLMALLLLGLQLALWGLAAHAVSLGVAEGGAAARASSRPRDAPAVVVADVHAIAGSLVGSLTVGVRSAPDDFVTVSASGSVPTIFPGLHLHVSAVSTGPVQGFRATG